MGDKSYRVTVKVRNANLLRAIERAGYTPGKRLANDAGIAYTQINDLVNMKIAPVNENGDIKEFVSKLATILRVTPWELFDAEQINSAVKTNSVEFDANMQEMVSMNTRTSTFALQGAVDTALEELSDREVKIIDMRFGITGQEKTLKEIATDFGVSTNRIRQIEQRALRKLRHRENKNLEEYAVTE